jgi:hypothetical protein
VVKGCLRNVGVLLRYRGGGCRQRKLSTAIAERLSRDRGGIAAAHPSNRKDELCCVDYLQQSTHHRFSLSLFTI